MDEPGLVIAIDGPSGSGKSSTARGVAARLGLRYLDTGAMYRAVAWQCLHEGLGADDPEGMLALARRCPVQVGTDPADPRIGIAGRDLTEAIREPRVSAHVSTIATVQAIRDLLSDQMRRIIAASGGIVAEGRDITTRVAPQAQVRVLLVADPVIRINRREAELCGVSSAEVEDQVIRRDRDDATVSQFERPAEGVTVIDSTRMSLAEVIDAVIDLVPAGLRGVGPVE